MQKWGCGLCKKKSRDCDSGSESNFFSVLLILPFASALASAQPFDPDPSPLLPCALPLSCNRPPSPFGQDRHREAAATGAIAVPPLSRPRALWTTYSTFRSLLATTSSNQRPVPSTSRDGTRYDGDRRNITRTQYSTVPVKQVFVDSGFGRRKVCSTRILCSSSTSLERR